MVYVRVVVNLTSHKSWTFRKLTLNRKAHTGNSQSTPNIETTMDERNWREFDEGLSPAIDNTEMEQNWESFMYV